MGLSQRKRSIVSSPGGGGGGAGRRGRKRRRIRALGVEMVDAENGVVNGLERWCK